MLFDSEIERAGALEVTIEAQRFDGRLNLIEVLQAEAIELLVLLRPTAEPVLFTVGEARFTETTVAAGCCPAEFAGFKQHDAGIGVALFGEHCGPQSEVTTTDNREVGGHVAL